MADRKTLTDRHRVLTMAEAYSFAGQELTFNIDWLFDFYQCDERMTSWV